MDTIDIRELEKLKDRVEAMDKSQHVEILKLLKKNPKIKLNENKSGVYVNLSFLAKESIDDLRYYLEYIDAQETSIMQIETQKEEFKNIFFDKSDKKESKEMEVYSYTS